MTRSEVGYIWIESFEEKKKRIGLSCHGIEHLGDIVWISLPAVGTHFFKEGTLFVMESSKAAIEVESPLEGKVLHAKECTEETLCSLKNNPDQTWLLEIESSS